MKATCKLGSKGCWTDGKCRYSGECGGKIVTNADHIRAMSDEELAKLLYGADSFGGGANPCRNALSWKV